RGGLEVHALDGVAALGDQREAAFGAGVDEHLVAGRGLAENAEPGEGVLVEVPLPGGVGIIARQGPREPSEPTTYRASMRSSSPSTVVAATQGRSLSISPRRVSDTA